MLEPMAFANNTLYPTEQDYANNRQEMLAVVSGLEKFQFYMFGRHILPQQSQASGINHRERHW